MKKQDSQKKVLTIPNILSLVRLSLIPVIVWLYCVEQEYRWSAYILILSGITDVADGFIARHFHMTSDLGKILDPVADKLTQLTMLICLVTRFPLMLVPLVLLVLKEFFVGITGIMVIRKTGHVFGARWHGKVATCLLDAMMILHVLWYDIPMNVSNLFVTACIAMMVVSLILYGMRNVNALKENEVSGACPRGEIL